MMEKKINKFDTKVLKIIDDEIKKSICLRSRVGAVIVNEKTKKIIFSAHNGNANRLLPCSIIGCAKKYFDPRPGERNEMCTGLCAEQRVIFNSLNLGHDLKDKTIYCNYTPCTACSRILVELDFRRCYFLKEYKDPLAKQILKMGNVELIKLIK